MANNSQLFNIRVFYLSHTHTTRNLQLHDRNYELNDLIQDPHILFKCDPRVFRSTHVLSIWLHMLSCLRTTSKHRIWKRYHTVFPRSEVSQILKLVFYTRYLTCKHRIISILEMCWHWLMLKIRLCFNFY